MVPRDSIRETTTDMFPHISDDDKFLLIALVLALIFGLFWWSNGSAKKWLEENGREEVRPSELDWLLRDAQQKPATPLKYFGARVSRNGSKGPRRGSGGI